MSVSCGVSSTAVSTTLLQSERVVSSAAGAAALAFDLVEVVEERALSLDLVEDLPDRDRAPIVQSLKLSLCRLGQVAESIDEE